MADDALLSDLCSICNTAKFKYRCPACSARTCSLPCYKRHQQWAQCNGKRDPAKFVKKSQLATPAGIDHDYNFLTNIERDLVKAEKMVEDRGFGSRSDPRRPGQGRQSAHQHYTLGGVTIIRAPKGMSRQKENKTHPSKKGKPIWTVEWILDDKTRVVTQTSSSDTILQVQPLRPSKATKKRKRRVDQSTSTSESVSQHVSPPIKAEEDISALETKDAQPESPTTGGPKPERDNLGATRGDATPRDATTTEASEVEVASDYHGGLRVHGSESESVPCKYAFYLLRPRTSSNRHVLILLDPLATLADCLRGRTVLEFPTIYIFPISASPPPEQFMLEAEYLRQEGEEQKEFEELIENVSPETLRALKKEQDDNHDASEEIDSDKILQVLKRDLGAGL